MSAPQSATERNHRLKEALAEHNSATGDGKPVDLDEFLDRYADVADDLKAILTVGDETAPVPRGGRSLPIRLPELAEYDVLDVLGEGGMGVVYLAHQKGTEQRVALKMLHPRWLDGMDEDGRRMAIEQFRDEVRAAARLGHENTIRILHMGEHQGRPFYAMQLIDGETLAERIYRHGSISREAAARYLAGVAGAVQEAHELGILHRDLKPHNILIDRRTDRALVADFGLARFLEGGGAGEGSSGPVLGTLPYMAPEQTLGADQGSAASDVYSLGATLYELLTGDPPFAGGTRAEMTIRIREDDPEPLRRRDPSISPQLERICMKCLRKDPAERYASAGELAHALEGYLDHIRWASQISAMGRQFLTLGPLTLMTNLLAFAAIRAGGPEALIWVLVFSMYLPLYALLMLTPSRNAGPLADLTRTDLWAAWGSKLFAALTIAAALRVSLHPDAERAILLSYPVFAALSGMAVYTSLARVSRGLAALFASAGWLVALSMLIHPPWSPLIYGSYTLVGTTAFGIYLRKVGREVG